MNIIIEKNDILAPISKLVNITEKRSLMPVLSNILLDIGKEKSVVYSTDLEVSAIAHIEKLKSEEPAQILVHGRKFVDIMREMDGGEITIEIDNNTLKIKQKHTEIVLSLQDPEEFPEVREIKGYEEFSISGAILLEMIEKVSFAISIDETRFILTGMYMKGMEGKIVVVGTDGFRMAQYQKEVPGLKGFKGITIPKRSISEVVRVVGEEDSVRLNIDDKHVQFGTDGVKVVSRIIEGNFPDYENVIPVNNNMLVITKDMLLRGLKKVSTIIGRSEPIKMMLGENKMELEAVSDIGTAKEVLDVEYGGENVSLNFNVRFILDVVSHIDEDEIIIKAPSTYGAVLFEGRGGEYYKNIVMPIRV
jgi:DNA polymerase III subunit beta